MRCGFGWTAGQCITDHYQRVSVLELAKSGDGPHWRGRCPLCGWRTVLEVTAKGDDVLARCWGAEHCPAPQLRAWLREHVPCLAGTNGGGAHQRCVRPADVVDLVTAKMPPVAMKLGLLEAAGMTTSEALDLLGIGRTNRYRVVSALRQSRRKTGELRGRRCIRADTTCRKANMQVRPRICRLARTW